MNGDWDWVDCTEEELSGVSEEELRTRVEKGRELWKKLQRACIKKGGADPDVFFNKSMPQSTLFMCECLTLIHDIFLSLPENICLEVLDVGPQTFAGTRLLAELHASQTFNQLKMKVSAVDIHRNFMLLKECICPDVEFIIGDVCRIEDRTWDLVICSHVIEHVERPEEFVRCLQRLSRMKVVIACPWAEDPIVTKGHRNTIGKAFVRRVGGSNLRIYTNFMWGKQREVCIFTLDGKAN